MAKINVRDRNKNFPDRKPNWEYRFEIAKIDGKRQSISKSGFRTKKDALEAGAKSYAEYSNTGKHFEASDISVADYFTLWYDIYVLKNTTMGTCLSYRGFIKNYINPRLGKYRLRDIDTATIQQFINQLCDEKKLVRKYIKSILIVLREALNYAAKTLHYISSNAAIEVTVPKTGKPDKTKKDVLPTKEQIDKLLNKFRHSPYQYYGILISYYTGMRVSETYGLTWNCIDFENKQIYVSRICKRLYSEDLLKLKKDENSLHCSEWCLGACKTASSERIITIGDTLVEALKALKQQQELNEKIYGNEYIKYYGDLYQAKTGEIVQRIIPYKGNEHDAERINFVLIKECGEYSGTQPTQYPKHIARKVLGIENFHFHQLRHYHATQLIGAGAAMKDVQARLGHANFQTTMNIYVHDTDMMKNNSVELFEKNSALTIAPAQVMSSSVFKLTPDETDALRKVWRVIKTYESHAHYSESNAKLCDEWLHNFNNFAEWSADNGFKIGSKIRRINKKEYYSPANCCWVA